MSDEREESVRRRAYELWEQEGGDHGHDQDHWHRANDEIAKDDTGGDARTAVAPYGTTIGDVSDTDDGLADAAIDAGKGASIVDAEVAPPATLAKPAARPRKPKTTK